MKARPNTKVKKSALEDELKEIRKIKLKAEKDKIKSELQETIDTFDKELNQMRTTKYQLQSDLTLV